MVRTAVIGIAAFLAGYGLATRTQPKCLTRLENVRYVEAQTFEPDTVDVVNFSHHFGIWERDWFGCKPRETDPSKCVYEAGGNNGPEFRASRQFAMKVFNLRAK